MSKLKKTVIIILMILFIIIMALLGLNSSKTVFNEENISGNTPGNLFNGGLFREYDDKIYFSNYKDNGSLYVMDLDRKNFKKLSNDYVGHINVLGKYIYYIRNNKNKDTNSESVLNFNSNGIFRMNLNGENMNMLYDKPSTFINVHGNYVYYQHYDKEGLTFYSVNIDGTEEKKISSEPIMPISIIDNTLYYSKTGDTNLINRMHVNGESATTIYQNENTYAPVVHDNYIYFISISDHYRIKRIQLDGSNPETVVDESCSTFNISDDGNYLYYQVDDTVNNRLCIMNLQTGEENTIADGDYKQINITSNYVYFTDFNEYNTYYLPIGATSGMYIFDPPILK